MLHRSFLILAFVLIGLTGCASTESSATQPKKIYNPGDELTGRPWGQGSRSSHYATPFGLPLSQ